jgi:hypothetical protein
MSLVAHVLTAQPLASSKLYRMTTDQIDDNDHKLLRKVFNVTGLVDEHYCRKLLMKLWDSAGCPKHRAETFPDISSTDAESREIIDAFFEDRVCASSNSPTAGLHDRNTLTSLTGGRTEKLVEIQFAAVVHYLRCLVRRTRPKFRSDA